MHGEWDDTQGVSESVRLPSGAAVLVLVAEPFAQALTRVVSDEPPFLAVDAPSLRCPASGVVTLVFGPRTARFAARARLVEKRKGAWVFERISPWVRFDGRKSARYPVRGMAQVTHAGQTTAARPVDISESGCGLAVPVGHAPDVGSPVTVAFQLFGGTAHACRASWSGPPRNRRVGAAAPSLWRASATSTGVCAFGH